MKNNFSVLALAASLVIAVNTEWVLPAKVLVIISSLCIMFSAFKELTEHESERNKD